MKLNKSSSQWKAAPLWVRIGMIGLSSRKSARHLELFSAGVGVLGLFTFMCMTDLAQLSMVLFFFGAYWLSAATRYIDNKHLWEKPLEFPIK